MCRIFGRLGGGPAGRADLARVSARQHHGGPDRQCVLTGDGWALGCNRLAVTDPHGGDQPYRLGHVLEDGILVAFNGEIYNHAELRRRLLARGHRVPDRCDGSVLPALYAEYGPAFWPSTTPAASAQPGVARAAIVWPDPTPSAPAPAHVVQAGIVWPTPAPAAG
ncbi:hypothetical protein [Kitasatospora sp. NPDC058190]|uniref:hypothetical protein n=1 Tax=Kitasatospora sp. NPDC058190 TaxID=3346371 RepID=UPI0036DE238A